MTITAASAQIAGQPVQNGARALRTPANVTAASPTGASIDVSCDLISFTLINTGTLDNAASLALQAQINGSSFFPVFYPGTTTAVTFTGTQINAGLVATLQIKALQVRFVLTPGTTTGSNGVIVRLLD